MREFEPAEDAFDATEALVEMPEWPDVLMLRESDLQLPIQFVRCVGDRIGPDSIDFAREALKGRRISARERCRLEEIVSAFDKFADALRLAKRLADLTHVQNRLHRLHQVEAKIYAAAGRIPAKSAHGVLFKLLISGRELVSFADEYVDEGSVGFVLASAALDALSLAGVEDRREIAEVVRAGSDFAPALMDAADLEAPESSL